jgi:hypothetical protein
MIPRPAGWSWEARGELIVAAPADGKSVGYVTYIERRRPLVRVSTVVAELEHDPRFRIVRAGKPERIVTSEGEYGAVVIVDGLLLEAPVQHTLGFVFMDDSFSLINGMALHPAQFGRFASHVKHLALNDFHMAGEMRRRRFFYEPPLGWGGIAKFLHTFWYPTDYPANRSKLIVIPAVPVPPGTKDYIDAIAAFQMPDSEGFALDSMSEARPLSTKNKLSGSLWEGLGRIGRVIGYRDIQVLDDGRYAYPVILESPRDKHDENLVLLRTLVDSIEPIPRPGDVMRLETKASMGHWAE